VYSVQERALPVDIGLARTTAAASTATAREIRPGDANDGSRIGVDGAAEICAVADDAEADRRGEMLTARERRRICAEQELLLGGDVVAASDSPLAANVDQSARGDHERAEHGEHCYDSVSSTTVHRLVRGFVRVRFSRNLDLRKARRPRRALA